MDNPVPDWLTVGVLVTLPDIDRRTARAWHRYRIVHIKPPASTGSEVEVGVQPVDAPEFLRERLRAARILA